MSDTIAAAWIGLFGTLTAAFILAIAPMFQRVPNIDRQSPRLGRVLIWAIIVLLTGSLLLLGYSNYCVVR